MRQVAEAGFDDVLVVVGYEHEQVLAALDGLRCRHAVNPDYATGMGSSFRTAVVGAWQRAPRPCSPSQISRSSRPRSTGACCDTYRTQSPGIVSVRYGDVTAPPHLFAREFFPELAVLEHGARPVLQRHRDRTVVLQFPPELLLDIDTPDDYERANARLSAGR